MLGMKMYFGRQQICRIVFPSAFGGTTIVVIGRIGTVHINVYPNHCISSSKSNTWFFKSMHEIVFART